MNSRLAFILIAAIIASSVFAQPKPFVSWLISPKDPTSAGVEVWPNGKSFIWRLISPRGEILAEMKQPAIPAGHTVNYGECIVNGEIRQDVIAIVRHFDRREWSNDIHSLWFADANARAFIKGDSRQVKCRNEDYGI